MFHATPDLGQGVLRERDGKRLFLRLWPTPSFMEESAPGVWKDVEDVKDDFNLTALVEVRDELVERHRSRYPSLIASILQGQQFLDGYFLPMDLKLLLSLQRRIEHRERFLGSIPADMLRLVRQYPEEHFRLLQFFASYPEAVEMAQSNPMLAFLVATHDRWRGFPAAMSSNTIRDVLRWKRRDILAWLRFDHAGKSLTRLIGSISPWACRSKLIVGLRESLLDPRNIRRLRHTGRINFGIMAIAADRRLLTQVDDCFLHEVAADSWEDRQAATAQKLRIQLPFEESGHLPGAIPTFHSRKKLQARLAASAVHMTSEEIETLELPFPKPPLENTAQIQALRTPKSIFREGQEQGNCVWNLLPNLLSGNMFLYRVLAPERATLAIVGKDKDWSIKEMEAAWGNPVLTGTTEYVQRWIADAMPTSDNCASLDIELDLFSS